MVPLPAGAILLTIVTVFVFLGFAERVIDRMRMSHQTAIALLILLIVAHFLPGIPISPYIELKLGPVILLGIVIYLLSTTSPAERLRAVGSGIATGAFLIALERLLPIHYMPSDPVLLTGLFAGLVAYLIGRSRRGAFCGAIIGILLADLFAVAEVLLQGIPQTTTIGGGGLFDAVTIAAILSVALAEGVGEIRERIHRGPAKLKNREGEDNA